MSATNPISNVVGSIDPETPLYLASGARNPNATPADQETRSLSSHAKLAEYMRRQGGVPVPIGGAVGQVQKGRRGRKSKQQPKTIPPAPQPLGPVWLNSQEDTQSLPPTEVEAPVQLITAVFHTGFGKVKVKLVDCYEHPMGYLLVFADEEAVTFEPKSGEIIPFELKTTAFGNTPVNVLYSGLLFNQGPDSHHYMVLHNAD